METNVSFVAPEFEILSLADTRSIAVIDAPIVSDLPPRKYAEENALGYYIICNTWLLQFGAHDNLTMRLVQRMMCDEGLIFSIKHCSDISDALLKGETSRSEIFLRLSCILGNNITEMLQVLRYPKRFSPVGCTIVESSSLSSFIDINRENREKCLSWNPPRWIRTALRKYGQKHCTSIKECDDLLFTSGTTADHAQSYAEKVGRYAMYHPCIEGHIEYPLLGFRNMTDETQTRVVCVPKSYKAARVIAEESVCTQLRMAQARLTIERWLKKFGKYADIHDQTFNMSRAREGSCDGSLATIDSSSASDRISFMLLYDLLPQPIFNQICRLITPYLDIQGKRYKKFIPLTSGASITFALETFVFKAISDIGTEYAQAFYAEKLARPSVYGDDIVCDSRAYETIIHVMEACGLVVNTDKSYAFSNIDTTFGTFFRESCGGDYYDGVCVSTRYFPRKTLRNYAAPKDRNSDLRPEILGSLCALQHRLFDVPECSYFLCTVIRRLYPRMTSSSVGSDCFDLWEYFPKYKVKWLALKNGLTFEWGFHANMCNVPAKRDHTKLEPCITSDLEMVSYYNFLKNGPFYEDPLMQLLGCSSLPVSETPKAFGTRLEMRVCHE